MTRSGEWFARLVIVACVLALALAFVAVLLLGLRDFYKNRAREEARPLEDRIRDFKEGAAAMIQGFERHAARPNLRGNRAFLPPIIDYYRRLEELATRETATSEEAMALADEALKYARENKLKAVIVMDEPRRLASLLQRRNAGGDSSSPTNGVGHCRAIPRPDMRTILPARIVKVT